MNILKRLQRWCPPLVAGLMFSSAVSAADEAVATDDVRSRFEVAIGTHSWPGIAGIKSLNGGSFDEVGLSLNAAAHFPWRRMGDGLLMAGVDIGLFSNDSNILLNTDTLISRGGFITPSVKWKPDANGRWSLDAGLGYYLVDIAEVLTDYFYFEFEVWQASAIGGFVGATWDRAPANPEKQRGLTASFKVHMADFGEVRDENESLPARFGPNAGKLSGPVYQLEIGYRWQ